MADPAKLEVEPAGSDPVTVEYCPTKRGYAVFEIPLEDCRAFHTIGLPLAPHVHPFVQAFDVARRDASADRGRRAFTEILERYYASVRPTSACDVVGLGAADAPGLRDVPPIGYLYPWSELGVAEIIARRKRSLKYVGMRYGVSPGDDAGHTFFGPVQAARVELQVTRLHALLEAVRRDGFKPFARDFPTKVVALRKAGRNRWLVEEGQHRFALGGALGTAAIPSIVTSVIRREDAPYWPQVVAGIFTEAGALALFDRLYDGVPAPIARDWSTAAATPVEPLTSGADRGRRRRR
ncbi:hypothetical protein [Sphingomonas sp.]|uniref:hypothetical protein n=1 Tax=Sphingomonas sp. TaxID=28214 RepID=UPI00286D9C4D|nr:hypothetical protein [Sphingomonas sp.]